ncbi:MAG: PH domain-containing protein [Cyclobacteriaceae bacterium]
MEENSFSEPSRQSPVAILIFLIKFVKMTVRQAIPIIISLIIGLRKIEFASWMVYIGAIVIAAIYIFFSIYSYLRFYYHIKDGEIIIKKGVFTRTTINLPFEKIQTIDFKQNLIQQIFGVVEFAIDSAGSSKKEVSLSAISSAHAEKLREYILSEKKNIAHEETASGEDTVERETIPPKLILRLTIPELLKVGITQNHIKSLGLIFVFFFGLLDQVRKLTEEADIGEDQLEETVNTYYEETMLMWIWLIMLVFVMVVPIFVSLFTTVFRYFDMQLLLGSDGIKLKSGLLNKKQRSTTLNKVQTISWGWNPLQKLLGLFTIKLYPATASAIKQKSILIIPGSREAQVDSLLDALHFTENSQDLKTHRMSSVYYVRWSVIVGVIPAIIIGSVLAYFHGWYALTTLLWPLFIFTESYVEYRKWRLYTNPHIIKLRYGLFGIHHKIIYWHKIQAITVSQSPYQYRKELATVTCYQAGHQINIPYISLELAKQIEQYALYKIETDQKGWM